MKVSFSEEIHFFKGEIFHERLPLLAFGLAA